MTAAESIRVGFVGLGNIGRPMAERIAISPFPLTVCDVRREVAETLAAQGAYVVSTPRAVGERSDLVGIVVQTGEQVRDVVVGRDGLLETMAAGTIIAVHSTMSLGLIKELAGICRERGVTLLDAAVSGGDVGARAGKLTFMIGGSASTLERCRPVFEHMAETIFHLGDVGAGQAGKLANNLLYNAGVVAAVESMRLAVAAGIPEAVAAKLFAASTGTNFMISNWERLTGSPWSADDEKRVAALRRKDVSLALSMAEELGQDVVLGGCVLERIDWAIENTRIAGQPRTEPDA